VDPYDYNFDSALENVEEAQRESIRLFSWEKNLDEVSVYYREQKTSVSAPGMGHQWHHHPQVELVYFVSGEGVRFIGDDISPFTSPEILLLGSQLPHYWKIGKSSGYAIQFRVSPDSPLAALREFSEFESLWERSSYGLLFHGALYRKLADFFKKVVRASSLSRIAMLLEIIDAINRGDPEEQKLISSRIISQTKSNAYQRSIQQAVQFITTHYTDDINIQDVLKACGLGRATFSRHFSRAMGHSYTSFLQSIRIENARRLIANGKCSVSEAAFRSGYNNLSHFNRVFARRWHCTPTEFKQGLTEELK